MTSFLCTVLLIKTRAESCLNARLLWGTLRFGPDRNKERGLLGSPEGEQGDSRLCGFWPIWTAGPSGRWIWSSGEEKFQQGGRARSTEQTRWVWVKSLSSRAPPCTARFHQSELGRASGQVCVQDRSCWPRWNCAQKELQELFETCDVSSWSSVLVSYENGLWWQPLGRIKGSRRQWDVFASFLLTYYLRPLNLQRQAFCQYPHGLGPENIGGLWPFFPGLRLLGQSWGWAAVTMQGAAAYELASLGWGQDQPRGGPQPLPPVRLFKAQLITLLLWGLKSTWSWPLTSRECCLGSLQRSLRLSLWEVQGGLHFSNLTTWREEVFEFWIPWLAWRGTFSGHAGIGWRKEQTSMDKLVTQGLICLWVGITSCSSGHLDAVCPLPWCARAPGALRESQGSAQLLSPQASVLIWLTEVD